MGDIMNIETRISQAERRWNINMKRRAKHVANSACPFCSMATKDGFHVFANGGYWCRQCGIKGWLDEENAKPLSEAEKLKQRITRLEEKQREQERRISQLERMARCTDHLRYHQALDDRALEYWWKEGMMEETINTYLLGYCERCPMDKKHRSSFTIPIINGGKLENIRHRLTNATDGDKYRPHMPDLGLQLFNADQLEKARKRIIIVEGEKKSIIAAQAGFPNVGITGNRSFKREWLEWFDHINEVIVALDPDAMESAYRLGAMFDGRARVAQLPAKIDDMIVKYEAGADDIEYHLRWARKVA